MVDVVRLGGNKRAVVARRSYASEWTPRKREMFLDHLSATCNVLASAKAAGMAPTSCYRRRRRDPAFEADWSAALKAGYEHLEAKLLELALGDAPYEPRDPDAVAGGARFDPEMALRLLGRHSRSQMAAPGSNGRRGPRYVRVPIEQVEKSLLRKLEAMGMRLEAEAAAQAGPDA